MLQSIRDTKQLATCGIKEPEIEVTRNTWTYELKPMSNCELIVILQ